MLKHVSITIKSLLAPLIACLMIMVIMSVFYGSYQLTDRLTRSVALADNLALQTKNMAAKFSTVYGDIFRTVSWSQGQVSEADIAGAKAVAVSGMEDSYRLLDEIMPLLEEEEAVLLSALRARLDTYTSQVNETLEWLDIDAFMAIMTLNSSFAEFVLLSEQTDQLAEIIQSRAQADRDILYAAQADSLRRMLIASVMALVGSLLAAFFFGRAIARPVKQLASVISRLAAGDFAVDFSNIQQRDEVGVMAKALDVLKVQLAERAAMEAQSQLSVNNGRIRQALDSANTNLIVADANDSAIFINQSMHDLLWTVRSDLVGVDVERLKEDTATLDLSNLNTVDMSVSRTRESECELTLGDITIRQILSPVLDESGEHTGTVLEWIDLSEERRRDQESKAATARELAQFELMQQKADALLTVVDAAVTGDLTRPVDISGDDAFGRIGVGLENFFSQLRSSIRNISVSASSLSDASHHLSSLNTQMNMTAEEASRQVTSMSIAANSVSDNVGSANEAVEGMSSSVRNISAHSVEAAEVAGQAVTIASSTDVLVKKLRESSVGIGNVIKVITSIAEQTNLLALNATIEAARAGDAGKGFAVVANEVKELAKATAQATDDISQRIAAIQHDSDLTSSAIGEIGVIIEKINGLQSSINSSIQEQSSATLDISRSVELANTSSSNIAQTTDQVANGVQDTLKSTQQATRATEELTLMARDLRELAQQFKVDADDTGTSADNSRQS